jgi:putative ABC transport system permease protein
MRAHSFVVSPRWRKLLGDVRCARGRFIGIAVAMAITIAIVAAILSARAILDREMNRNYLDTMPPSAVLTLTDVDEELLSAVRAQSGIVSVGRTAVVAAKAKLPSGDPIVLLLRVVPDFGALNIARFYPQSGAWPPAVGEVLIERAVARMMPINIGATLPFELNSGEQRTLRIAGTVHDPGEAPAWQDRVIYGYITVATLATLGVTQHFDQLQVVTEAGTTDEIKATTRALALWLRGRGQSVQYIRIPPPGAHPHQWQIDLVSLFLLGFGLLAIVLEAALLAIVIGGMLAPQIRQIAVMKAIGARTTQIAGMYSALVLVLATAALSIGMPLGALMGHWLASFIADLLNFNINNASVPTRVYGICVLIGVVVPLCAAAVPIISAARKSVRASIDYFGVASNSHNQWLHRTCNRIRVNNVSVQLALRNLSRRKAQVVLALSLLVLTGTAFMLAGNVLRVWQTVTNASIAEQRFDIQVSLRRDESEAAVMAVIKSIAGVRVAEPARTQWASVDDGDELAFSNRGLPLRAVIPGSDLQRLDVQDGRWLSVDDKDAVVLNGGARATVFADTKVGDAISLLVNGKPLRLRVVGMARSMFSSAEAFTTPSVMESVTEANGLVRTARVGLQAETDVRAAADAIEAALIAGGFSVRGVYAKALNSAGITAHTYMLIAMLLLIVVSVAKIAIAGLASCMSTAVIERTREFGVMRTLGARAYDIQNSIILEAIMIGVISWLLTLVCTLPLTIWIGNLMSAAVHRSLPMVYSPLVALLWLIGVVLVATIASVAPARRAAALTIRQTLAST